MSGAAPEKLGWRASIRSLLSPSRGTTQRALLGFGLLALSVPVQWLDTSLGKWLEESCKVANPSFWCSVAEFGLVRLGLGAVWAGLFAAGLFYLVLYDWLQGYLARVSDRALETALNIRRIVASQVEGGRLSAAEKREIGELVFAWSSGSRERLGKKFGEFVLGAACDRAYPVWRSSYISNIVIEELPADKLGDRYFLWDEKRSYRLTRAGDQTVAYLVKASSQTEAKLDDIGEMVRNFDFRCSATTQAETVWHLDPAQREAAIVRLASGEDWSDGPFFFGFSNDILRFRFAQEIQLDRDEITVTTVEKSCLRKEDREYVQSIYGPVHGLSFWFKVPPGYIVEECHASVEDFQWEPGKHVPGSTARAEGRDAEVLSPGWVLPGIACVVIWKPMG